MEEEEKTYSVEVKCTNCGWEGLLDIPIGIPVEEMECPTCGVIALAKKEEQATK